MSTLLASGTMSRSRAWVLTLAFGALFSAPALGQNRAIFSVDWQGQTVGEVDGTTNAPITEGDLLIQQFGPFPGATTPLPTPQIEFMPDFLQGYGLCGGHPPGTFCGVEIDAMSFGADSLLLNDAQFEFRLYFSVDEFANGVNTGPGAPNLFSEAAGNEAAADMFVSEYQGIGPFPPQGFVGNIQAVDGDGRSLGAGVVPGLGLVEPSQPSPTVPDSGSNIDAFELATDFTPASSPLYFSMEGAIPDPFELGVMLSDSAAQQGVRPSDVLRLAPGSATFVVYANADALGLDNLGIGSDDIDALMVVENGTPGYQGPQVLYDWTVGASDLILFSVRRGSAVVGQPDSLFGIPIVPGDVLIAPMGSGLLGTANPGIFVSAESMGLATNRATGMSDELNALDITDADAEPINDCNGNEIEDATDIADGTSMDVDGNGIPDECESPGSPFCDCDTIGESSCGNTAGTFEGCANGTGSGGKLVGTGTSSIATDSLILTSSQLAPSNFGLVFTGNGTNPHTPVGSGTRCVGGTAIHRLHVGYSGPLGTFTYGPGILGTAGMTVPGFPTIMAGETWHFQTYYRDHSSPCAGPAVNMTNGWSVMFTP